MIMTITGEMLIGARAVRTTRTFKALVPETGEAIEPAFSCAAPEDVAEACRLADAAFDTFRGTDPEVRAAFLEAIGDEIAVIGDALVERAMAESALPKPRLEGERARTIAQLRLFAAHIRKRDWLNIEVDLALPDRKPLPRPDLRRQNIALGPVAVFGSSNFPLAFSVAGGDTAAALAAGCPVVVKAHAAHPGTSELVGRAIRKAAVATGMPEGVFSLLFDDRFEVGQALVQNPAIQAVGFTGSRRGGLALVKLAQARQQPIPVYAEMSSVNPVFLLPASLAARQEALATGFVDSLTLGVGQFCTNPGLLLGVRGPALDAFTAAAGEALRARPAGVMLSAGIAKAYDEAVARLATHPRVERVAEGTAPNAPGRAQPMLFRVTASAVMADTALTDEVFGPCGVIIDCADADEMVALARTFEGQLTATLQYEEADLDLARRLLPVLERMAGRILVNGWPTGVEVCDAMVHGGPYPATSDARTTSVGTLAIERFLRPVCYQSMPPSLLPPVFQDA
jgi:NADP-dependent aldehyde dehydrogenase